MACNSIDAMEVHPKKLEIIASITSDVKRAILTHKSALVDNDMRFRNIETYNEFMGWVKKILMWSCLGMSILFFLKTCGIL